MGLHIDSLEKNKLDILKHYNEITKYMEKEPFYEIMKTYDSKLE